MRAFLFALISSMALTNLAVAGQSKASRVLVNIPPEDLGIALKTLAQERTVQILYRTELVKGVKTHGTVGNLTTNEALTQLLVGTGLTYRYVDDKTVTIEPARKTALAVSRDPKIKQNRDKKTQRSFSRSFRLARVDQGAPASSAAVGRQADTSQERKTALAEVIIVAQKQRQRLLDVPLPVSVTTATPLSETNETSIENYFNTVPDLAIQPTIEGIDNLSIRGLSTGGFSNPTVTVTIDDAPYGGSNTLSHGEQFPDLDPSDITSIEVLRGPQGTLYGASAIGGVIRYVTTSPSTKRVFGQLQEGFGGVQNGAELAYTFRGFINVPVADNLAVRLSAFTRQDPGYIDNPVLRINGINEVHTSGGHVALLWTPLFNVSVKLGAIFQDSKGDGQNDVYTGNGFRDLQQNFIAGAGSYTRKAQFYSADINAKVGNLKLTSVTGFSIFHSDESFDLTPLLLSGPVTPVPYTTTPGTPGSVPFPLDVVDAKGLHKITQEIRLRTTLWNRFDVLFGVFYDHESAVFIQNDPVTDLTTGALLAPSEGFDSIPVEIREEAAFLNMTLNITNKFDIQVGGRESHVQESEGFALGGPLFGVPLSPPVFSPTSSSSANPFTYLFTPRYKILPSFMVYGRVTSGYGIGGANLPPNKLQPAGTVPPVYHPQKVFDYEVGAKGDFLDNTLSIDTSLYYIDWKQLQLSLVTPSGFGFMANGSRAKSEGVDASVEWSPPLAGLSVGGWVSYDEAVLTKPFPAGSTAVGRAGEELPNSAKWSGSFYFTQDFPLVSGLTGSVGGRVNLVGHRKGLFSASPVRQDLGGYATTDLHIAVRSRDWNAELYVDNVADVRGRLSGGLGSTYPTAFHLIRPRIIGITVTRNFKSE